MEYNDYNYQENDMVVKTDKGFKIVAFVVSLVALPFYFLPFIKISLGELLDGLASIFSFSADDYAPTGLISLFTKGDAVGAIAYVLGSLLILAVVLQLVGTILGFAMKKNIAKILNVVFNALAFAITLASFIVLLVKYDGNAKPTAWIFILLILQAVSILFAILSFVRFKNMPAEGEYGGYYDQQDMGGYNGNQLSGNITFLGGSCAGYSVPVMPGDEIVVGKDPAVCNIVIDKSYSTVSRKHVSITFDATSNMYIVTDTSSNGTRVVGGAKLTRGQPAYLDRGTTLNLGKTNNTLRLD